jgi:hypothetical protein
MFSSDFNDTLRRAEEGVYRDPYVGGPIRTFAGDETKLRIFPQPKNPYEINKPSPGTVIPERGGINPLLDAALNLIPTPRRFAGQSLYDIYYPDYGKYREIEKKERPPFQGLSSDPVNAAIGAYSRAMDTSQNPEFQKLKNLILGFKQGNPITLDEGERQNFVSTSPQGGLSFNRGNVGFNVSPRGDSFGLSVADILGPGSSVSANAGPQEYGINFSTRF